MARGGKVGKMYRFRKAQGMIIATCDSGPSKVRDKHSGVTASLCVIKACSGKPGRRNRASSCRVLGGLEAVYIRRRIATPPGRSRRRKQR